MSIQLCHCVGVKANRDGVIGRRDFLKGISAGAIAGGLAGGLLHWTDLVTAQAGELRNRGMACILLWMQGGPSQFETFSPKPGTTNGGETKAISTAVSGIQIAEGYSELAKQAKDIAFIRSVNSREGAIRAPTADAHRLPADGHRQISHAWFAGRTRNRRHRRTAAFLRPHRRRAQTRVAAPASWAPSSILSTFPIPPPRRPTPRSKPI